MLMRMLLLDWNILLIGLSLLLTEVNIIIDFVRGRQVSQESEELIAHGDAAMTRF